MRELLDDVFEELALAIGGLVALYALDDEIVVRLCNSLTIVRKKALNQIDEGSGTDRTKVRSLRESHPAIDEFLKRLR